ncbi:MAG TPA: aminoacyl-tRNA hydrolase [Ignavibacteria bacterium]|nr:aminoacyl-tRNA hydrolase [Ignavibacteria bacterium]
MKFIIGFGNTGSKYELTRHNIGFIAIDLIVQDLGLKLKPSKGEWYGINTNYKGKEIYLMKPITFMNASGEAVRDFMEKNSVDKKDILIICDDFQLPLGTIRIRPRGSDGGHNGLSSIIYQLNSEDIPRMRIGIGGDEPLKKEDYISFVLSNFSKEEIEKLKLMSAQYRDAVYSFIEDGLHAAMNRFNKNFIPPVTSEDQNINLIN